MLGLPTVAEVKEGVIASKLAAHAADIAKGIRRARETDLKVSKARYSLNWKKMLNLFVDPEKATKIFKRSRSKSNLTCTMCGEFCAMKKTREIIKRS